MSPNTQIGVTQYRFGLNALGQRVSKTGPIYSMPTFSIPTTYYVYDESGHLIGEYDANGASIQEHLWLGDQPVAVITASGEINYILSDHLNTPRQIINANNQLRWRWDNQDPFGANPPNNNPQGLGSFTYHLRFPGQYFDSETGLHDNYFRVYDPNGGRYTQSDPIGLGGGLNTYGYVGGNPMFAVDPLGLLVIGRGCNKAQEQQLINAEAKIRRELEKGCSECNSGACVPCAYLQQLKQALDRLIVVCMNFVPGTCANGGEGTGIINIENSGFNKPNKKQCGCLESVIYHEMFHEVGLPNSDHAIIEGHVMQCFGSCARRHDPNKYPDYAPK